MSDLFLPATMMVFVILVMIIMCFIFKDWFKERDRIMRESGHH
jgi:Na+/H+ antiporter NhaD/arsenite permease-like protein